MMKRAWFEPPECVTIVSSVTLVLKARNSAICAATTSALLIEYE
jgi:hypothetical protein